MACILCDLYVFYIVYYKCSYMKIIFHCNIPGGTHGDNHIIVGLTSTSAVVVSLIPVCGEV